MKTEETQTTTSTTTQVGARTVLESLLLASEEPLSEAELIALLPEFDEGAIRKAIAQMRIDFSGIATGIHMADVAGGLQLRTNPEVHDYVLRLFEAKPSKLSKAAMETLAIVAYRQPVTRAQIDEIRGVDSTGVVKKLTELELVVVVGKMDDIGRPNLYGTTNRFLEFFGLNHLADLPLLDDLEFESLDLALFGEEE